MDASEIKTDAVRSAEVKDGEVKTADLAASAVTGAKIAANTILQNDIADNAVGKGEMVKWLFLQRRYTVSDGESDQDIDTNVSANDWFPTIMGFSQGSAGDNIDLDDSSNGGDPLAVIWSTVNNKWRINVRSTTPTDHAKWTVDVVWIPRKLVESTTWNSTDH